MHHKNFTRMETVISSWVFLKLITAFTVVMFKDSAESSNLDFDVVVDLTSSSGDMKRIWDNTGLSPPGPGKDAVEYLTSKEQLLNLALIGSLPFKAITHVRIHWMLDLIIVNSTGTEYKPEFDYQSLDVLIKWLKLHRMRPGFELMGNPGELFDDLNFNPDKEVLWQNLVTDLGSHYIETFGKEEVKKWRFELWNEPDSKQYNILNLTTSGYLKYAVASIQGLKFNGLSVSGPAGTFKDFQHHNISWSLLQFCNSMISISGSCGLDTITFHKKGEGSPYQVVTSTTEFYSNATRLFPLLRTLPFANNEADILSGWWREEEWRGDVNYAAAVCEVIALLLAEAKQQNISLAYISNDNGFINQPPAYFDQRTLLTRFQINSRGDAHNQFIRKPVMMAMALLSYLGPKEMPVFFRQLNCFKTDCDSRLSVMAAGDGVDISPGWSAAVILAVTSSSSNCSDKTVNLRLRLPENIELTYLVYQLDNVLTNPRKIWEQSGKPESPDIELLNKMRGQEGPYILKSGSFIGKWQTLFLRIRCPSVSMVHLCAKPHKSPGKVLQLHAINITFNEVLLLWQDSDTRCVKTYEVYFCSGHCLIDHYNMISSGTNIMLSYQFRVPGSTDTEATRGRYKVRVRDYWDQLGKFSDVLPYP